MTAERPRFAVSERGDEPIEHRLLAEATRRVLAGRPGVMVEDRARGVVRRAGRARRWPLLRARVRVRREGVVDEC